MNNVEKEQSTGGNSSGNKGNNQLQWQHSWYHLTAKTH